MNLAVKWYKIVCLLILGGLLFGLGVTSCEVLKSKEISLGGTLVSTTTVVPRTFNPLLARETESSRFTHYYIFEPLVIPDGKTQRIKPCLAKDWTVKQNGKVWLFHLREDVHWNDGAKFSAEDVVFTFELIYGRRISTSYRKDLLIAGEPIKVSSVDKYTVKLILPQPYGPLLRQLPVILPRHKLYENWQQGNIDQVWNPTTNSEEIVGTGPFQLSKYQLGQKIVLTANPYYWRTDETGRQLPYIDRWVRKIVHDSEAKWEKFRAGINDYSQIINKSYPQVRKQAQQTDYRLVNAGASFRTTFIVFNQNPVKLSDNQPRKLDWFTNLHFRRAVAYAVDRQQISQQVFGGQAQPQWSPVSRANKLFYNKKVKKYRYNLKLARQQLKQGGFSWNQTGELVGPQGHKVKFSLATNQDSSGRRQMLNIIQKSLNELGMKIELKFLSFNQLINQLINKYNYDGVLIGFQNNGVDPELRANIWQSSGSLHLWHPQQNQPSTKWEAKIDRLFERGATTINLKTRKKIYNRWQKIVAAKLPLIYIVNCKQIFAVQERLQNTDITSYGKALWGEPIWNAARIYLKND